VVNVAAEKNFENRVKKYLDEYGCWWLKYWGGAAYTKSGIPDLLASSDGCFLGIEVKADNGEPSLIQLYHLRKIRESGGYGILLFPKDFEKFKGFNEHKSKSNAWYLSNIEEQKRWKIKLEEKEI
jgi:Holliday junction resolvase